MKRRGGEWREGGKTVKLMSLAHFTAFTVEKASGKTKQSDDGRGNLILKVLLSWKGFGLDSMAKAAGNLFG